MKIIIFGADGYIGFPLYHHLKSLGHDVSGVDDYSRRRMVKEVGSDSLTPLPDSEDFIYYGKLGSNYDFLKDFLQSIQPDAIVHLAEQPSAPYSMVDVQRACDTQVDNIVSTTHLLWAMKEVCPSAHLVKLGSMGEYGTPKCDIPEGVIPNKPCAWTVDSLNSQLSKKCPMSGLPFPRSPFSFYHLSKVHDTHNIIFACKNWDLRSTDIMQGIVLGVRIPTVDQLTRFDYDQYFGTAINRFCVQAISGHPLTVYGEGTQTRGFLPLKDSIQCLTLAIENPPFQGEYRTLNQFENTYSIFDLAKMVVNAAYELGIGAQIKCIPNPRVEQQNHYYNPAHQKLFNLGYRPTTNIFTEIKNLMVDLLPFKYNIKPEVILPTTTWR